MRIISWGGQRDMPEVVAKVEVGIIHPYRPTLSERHSRQSLAVARHQVKPRSDVFDELVVRRGRAIENKARSDVHVSSATF